MSVGGSGAVRASAGESGAAIRLESVAKAYVLGTNARRASTLVERLRRRNKDFDSESSVMWAVRDLDLTVQPGETLALIGRNGAGKSTILKLIARITPPTLGRITVRGRIGSLLEIGTGFHPELTGRENVYFNSALLGTPPRVARAKFDEIVSFAGVERYLDTPVKRYSSGMYMRLAFSVAAHVAPEILIVDEVLAVGDAEFQTRCLAKMRELMQDEGRSILFVSHNLSAVETLCERAVLMQDGRMAFAGTAHEAIHEYMTRLAAVAVGDAHRPGWFEGFPDRIGYEELIESVAIRDAAGELAEGIVHGESVTFDVALRRQVDASELYVGITVTNETGQAISYTTSKDVSSGSWRLFQCEAKRFMFVPGRYVLTIGVRAHGASHWADYVEGAASFRVHAADASRWDEDQYGLVALDASWEVR